MNKRYRLGRAVSGVRGDRRDQVPGVLSPAGRLRLLAAIGLVAEGEDRHLDAVLQADFGEDAAHVGLDGLLTDRQIPGDWVSRVSSSGLRLAVPSAAARTAAMTCSAEAVLCRYEVAPACIAHQVLIVDGGGEHDDRRLMRRVAECGEHRVPVQSGHVQVEQQHVRAGGGHDVHRLPAVPGFAGDLDVRFLAGLLPAIRAARLSPTEALLSV